jgi:hypothetical protein
MAHGLVYTLRPAFHRFADIVQAHIAQRISAPESLYDAFDKLKRIEAFAEHELVSGLWDAPIRCGQCGGFYPPRDKALF